MLNKLKRLISKLLIRQKGIKIGKNTRILTSIKNFGSEPYLVKIGDDCIITSGVKFITHDASIAVALKYNKIPREINGKKKELMGKIVVGDNVRIGVNTIVLTNVTIGSNVIVGASSVVSRTLLPNSVYAGNPAKYICTIEEYYSSKKDKMIEIDISKNKKRRDSIENELESRIENNETT